MAAGAIVLCITTGANSFDGLRPLGPSKFIEGKNWKKIEIEKVRESGQRQVSIIPGEEVLTT